MVSSTTNATNSAQWCPKTWCTHYRTPVVWRILSFVSFYNPTWNAMGSITIIKYEFNPDDDNRYSS